MNKALFLDRDGVIMEENGTYTTRLDEIKVNDGVAEGLKRCIDQGYLLIVISNQGGIAKGLLGKEDVRNIHQELSRRLAVYGVSFTEFYYCPHHPDYGYCMCRKPDSLMIEKALARFNIDPHQSYMIGDSERDAEAAEKAGVSPIKITANQNVSELLSRQLGI